MAIGTLLLQGNLEDTEGISMGMVVRIQPPQRHLEDICTGTWTSPPQEHLKLDEDIRDNTTPSASGEHRQGDRDGVTTTLRDLAHREDTGMGTPPTANRGHQHGDRDISMGVGTPQPPRGQQNRDKDTDTTSTLGAPGAWGGHRDRDGDTPATSHLAPGG